MRWACRRRGRGDRDLSLDGCSSSGRDGSFHMEHCGNVFLHVVVVEDGVVVAELGSSGVELLKVDIDLVESGRLW